MLLVGTAPKMIVVGWLANNPDFNLDVQLAAADRGAVPCPGVPGRDSAGDPEDRVGDGGGRPGEVPLDLQVAVVREGAVQDGHAVLVGERLNVAGQVEVSRSYSCP